MGLLQLRADGFSFYLLVLKKTLLTKTNITEEVYKIALV